jgi:hypothetical protein
MNTSPTATTPTCVCPSTATLQRIGRAWLAFAVQTRRPRVSPRTALRLHPGSIVALVWSARLYHQRRRVQITQSPSPAYHIAIHLIAAACSQDRAPIHCSSAFRVPGQPMHYPGETEHRCDIVPSSAIPTSQQYHLHRRHPICRLRHNYPRHAIFHLQQSILFLSPTNL